jgi:alkylated DNA repair dioxygenase AlkB
MSAVRLDLPNAHVTLHSDMWTPAESTAIEAALAALPDWETRQIVVWGRKCSQNRKTCFYARETGINYRYSGIDNGNAKPFPPVVEAACKRVEGRLQTKFNYCLLNMYADGKETIGWHSDDERDMPAGSLIASCSFGAARFFDLRRKDDHSQKTRIDLTSGSMVVMGAGTQEHYHHQVPRQAKVALPRYNLTFRCIRNQ